MLLDGDIRIITQGIFKFNRKAIIRLGNRKK